MIIYNVTINIDSDVQDQWLKWMKEVHIPDVMDTGLFESAKILKIHAEEDGGRSYSIQYRCESWSVLEQYETIHAPKLQLDHKKHFEGKFAAFRTMLEEVQEF